MVMILLRRRHLLHGKVVVRCCGAVKVNEIWWCGWPLHGGSIYGLQVCVSWLWRMKVEGG